VRRRALVGCEMSGEVSHALARLGWHVTSADLMASEKEDKDYVSPASRERPARLGSVRHYQGDVLGLFSWDHPLNAVRKRERDLAGVLRDCPVPLFDLAVLHPPCDHLAQAGAVWWKRKDATRGGDGRMQEGAAFFMKMVKAPAPLVAVENPVGVMCRVPDPGDPDRQVGYRRPDQVVGPWWFGDPLAKKTCWWLKGLPLLVADNPVEPAGRVATGGGSWRTDQRSGRGANNGHEDGEGRKNRKVVRSRTMPGMARAMASQWTAFVEEQERAA
jgi:hypothetical protein